MSEQQQPAQPAAETATAEQETQVALIQRIPKRIFVVPYRNRVQHKFFFCKQMEHLLEGQDDYEIVFAHQCDARTFNRGATRNIGFIAMRNKYPEHYKDMTFIFHDIDTLPFDRILSYDTTPGVVKHYYGFRYTLGGIVAIKGGDFERTNGYPCFWGWGMEDNAFQRRCLAIGLHIDRSLFFDIGDPHILQFFDGISRVISKKDPWRGENDDGIDGLMTIHQLRYTVDVESQNPEDNVHVVESDRIFYVNIATFLTRVPFGADRFYEYDLREPKRKIIHPDKLRETTNFLANTTDWSNIPFYPTTRENRLNLFHYLRLMGKEIPEKLQREMQEDVQKAHAEDAATRSLVPFSQPNTMYPTQPLNPYAPPLAAQPQQPQQHHPMQHSTLGNYFYQQSVVTNDLPYAPQQQMPWNPYHNAQPPLPTRTVFANQPPATKPRATASARIGLGGVY